MPTHPGVHSSRGRLLGSTVLVVVSLVVAACGTSSSPPDSEAGRSEINGDEGEPVEGGVLVVAVDSETSGWNPAIDRWAPAGALVGSSVLEPLATLDADAVAQPWLATGWEANQAHDVWTVELRDDVRFHDGARFDAEAVKVNLDHIVEAPLSSVAMRPVFDEVVVVDDRTVEVRLKTSWAAFPSSFLAGQSALMRSPASMQTPDQGSRHPVGTGPFVFREWRPDSAFITVANPDYWIEGQPHLDGIEYRPIADPTSRAAALESGDVDMAVIGQVDTAHRLDGSFRVLRNWDVTPAALLTNVRPTIGGGPNPMSNVHARRAMAHAIDPEAIAATIGADVEIPTSPFSPENPWGQPSEENRYPQFDLDAAEQELAAYREQSGQEVLRVTILGPSDTGSQSVLQVVQQQLAAAGIEADIEGLEAGSLISTVVSARYEVAMFSNYSSPDPDQNHYFWSADTAPGEGEININFTGFTNETTEAALRQGRESDSFEVRKQAYNTLVEEFNVNAVHLWLYYIPSSLAAAPKVKGLSAIGDVRFANFQPKVWIGGLWLAPN
jgi:peptide/nickel transport system substrate-binding protein